PDLPTPAPGLPTAVTADGGKAGAAGARLGEGGPSRRPGGPAPAWTGGLRLFRADGRGRGRVLPWTAGPNAPAEVGGRRGGPPPASSHAGPANPATPAGLGPGAVGSGLAGWSWQGLGIPLLAGELPRAVYAGSARTPAIGHLLATK